MPRAAIFRAAVEDPAADLLAPSVCDAEAVSALRRLVLHGAISLEVAEGALRDYVALPIDRADVTLFLQRVLDLRHNFGAFDAIYVALAEAYGATLVTADQGLARTVREHL